MDLTTTRLAILAVAVQSMKDNALTEDILRRADAFEKYIETGYKK